MNLKNYVISQRLAYLGLGSLVGFAIALNKKPLSYYMILGFVLLVIVVSEYFRRKE